jgi:hypothetical protein
VDLHHANPPRTLGCEDGPPLALYGQPGETCAVDGCATVLRASNPFDVCDCCRRRGVPSRRRPKRDEEGGVNQKEQIIAWLDAAEFLEWVTRPATVKAGAWQGRICDLRKEGLPVETRRGGLARWEPASERGQALHGRRRLGQVASPAAEPEAAPAAPPFAGLTRRDLVEKEAPTGVGARAPLADVLDDPEQAAIALCIAAFRQLDEGEPRARVAAYVASRYGP